MAKWAKEILDVENSKALEKLQTISRALKTTKCMRGCVRVVR